MSRSLFFWFLAYTCSFNNARKHENKKIYNTDNRDENARFLLVKLPTSVNFQATWKPFQHFDINIVCVALSTFRPNNRSFFLGSIEIEKTHKQSNKTSKILKICYCTWNYVFGALKYDKIAFSIRNFYLFRFHLSFFFS